MCLSIKNMYGEVEVKFYVFLISTLDGGEWLASSFGRSMGNSPREPLNMRLGVPTTGTDATE
jgi:hypothetical protein